MKQRNKIIVWALSLLAAVAVVVGGINIARGAVGDVPPHTKTLTDNHDGTYTLALDVVGEAEKQPNNVNVIVIFDKSGSMNNTRMSAAKSAVNNLADQLFAYNTPSEPNTVQMALVDFSTHANANQPTNSATTFKGQVNSLTADGGTNWEAALKAANGVSFGDNDQTFVVFVSDGNPTFRDTQGTTRITDNRWYNYDNIYYNSDGVYGLGSDNPNYQNYSPQSMQYCYNHAVDDAQTLVGKVGGDRFFTIGAFGNAQRMEDLTDDAGSDSSSNYYAADDTAALNKALSDILAKIEMSGIANASVEDGTTNQVTTSSGDVAELLEVDTSSFKYYRSGGTYGSMQPWSDAPAAKFANGKVDWDLSELGVLENGVRYTVTFDCYPSQETYDTIAKLKNGDITYNSLDSEVKKYIVDNGDGSYSLRTNTNATLSYDDTRDNAGQQTAGYKNPDPVATAADSLPIEKKWEGADPDVTSIPITVMTGKEVFHTANLTATNGWKTSSYISVGIIKNGKALPGAEGHDFSFAELGDEQYHWELDAPTVHPMRIGEDIVMLIKVDKDHPAPSGATTYTIGDGTYFANPAVTSLTATNYRRSNLNLKKNVTGEDAPKDATFPFTLKVNNSKAPATEPAGDTEHNSDYWVWFSIYDTTAGVTVTNATVSGATGPSASGYYYAPSGSAITVQMKAGWNLRFTNLPTGTTYSFAEGDLADGFAFNKAELTTGVDSTFSGAKTTTGTIENTKTSYQVEYTNDYQLTNLEITKVWDDNKNQDGKRLTADELKAKLTLSPAVQGKEPTVVDNGDDTYTITYTGLPRFNNGQEVEYTVAESAIDGYTTTGSPAKDHGTITNTHEPEVIKVTVRKVWDDSNDIGKIRPASINAQLTADDAASGDPVALNDDNEWTYTWENLPKYKDGKEIVYKADETAIPAGYTKTGPVSTVVEGGSPIIFTVTNTYNPTPVSVDPPVQKVITGNDDLYNGGDFTFTIEATEPKDAPMPAKTSITNSAENELEGKKAYYEFGEITFTMPGTYTYLVKESGSVDGVTNDPAAADGKTLTFTVTDDGTGKLVVSPTTDQVQLSFTNVYDADGEASIVVSKEITGAAWPAGKTLTLSIAGADGAPMPENTTASLTAAGSVTFGPIAYGLSDAGKSYEYTITESSFGEGWSGSPASVKATVTVTDNGDGTLGTTVAYSPEDAKFTNTYKASGKATLEVEKKLEGAAWPEGKTLTMTLAGQDGAPMPAEGGESVELTAAGKATFGEIAYTEADAGKTYTYTISEDGFGDGWTGSGDVTATVVVTDNGDGTLKTEVTYSPEDDTITNTYEAEGEAVLEATKAIKGAAWPAGKTLTLTLAGEGGTLPTSKTVELTEAGKATFGAITYTEADAGKTYEYTITESSFGDGWTGAPASITAKVEVTDNGDGTLATNVTYTPENATFTNTYKAEGKAELKVTKALAGAAWPAGKTLTLTLAGEGGTLPENKTATLTAAGEATFDAITYTEADAGKTYTYTISEDGFGKGWTGSGDVTATVEVTDNGDGSLATKITYSPEDDTITNTYTATGEAKLEVTKALVGAAWPEGKTLTLTLAGEGGTLPETKTATLSAAGKASFDAITYTEADAGKTYTYTISEDGFGEGWTGSGDVTATVKVIDNGDGTLKTEITYSPNNATIINTYKAEGEAVLQAAKVLEGREWKEGETFTFTLYGPDGKELGTQTVSSNSTVSFDAITYTEADAGKTFEYTISETGVLPSGVKKSADIKATVTVSDKGDGSLATEVKYDNNDTITNTYTADPVKAKINVAKQIKGYIAGEDPNGNVVDRTFEFTLTPTDGAPGETQTKTITTNGGEGSVDFDEIEYTFDDMKDEQGNQLTEKKFTYTVKETAGSDKGYTYDQTSYDVVVTVKDTQDGKLEVTDITKYGEKTNVEVVNEFSQESTEVVLTAHKTIVDESNSAEDADFTFVLTPVGSAPGEPQTKTVTTDGLKGSVDFDPIKFTAAGTYEYTIEESGTAPSGWTYDKTIHNVEVIVNNNFETAVLEKATTIDGADTLEVTFTNTYKAAETAATLKVTKEVEDTSGSAGDVSFEFTLASEGSPMPEVVTGYAKAGETAEFGPITYTKAGTYNYTITETKGGDTAAGWTNDTTSYPVVVTVEDVDAKLVADVNYGEDRTELTVTNVYDPKDATATPKALKTIDDQSNSAPNETFTFNLLDASGTVVDTVSRENGGPVEFGELTFDKVGTYTYSVQEIAGTTNGYTYDTAEHALTIEVTDAGKGELVANITYDDGDQAVINNVYKAEPTEIVLDVNKAITGLTGTETPKTFEFSLTGEDAELTTSVEGEGTASFDAIKYEKAGTYTYTVSEVNTGETGYTYDSSVYVVSVEVKDVDGKLEATTTITLDGEDAEALNFENPYKPLPTSAPIKAKKVLEGRDLKAGEFTFNLMDSNGKVVATVTNSANGTVDFGTFTFDEVGTFTYTASEVEGKDSKITYDTSVKTYTVEVEDVDGQLVATVTCDDESATFTNTYKPDEPKKKIPPVIRKLIPRTGDPAAAGNIITLSAMGTASLLTGIRLRRKNKKH